MLEALYLNKCSFDSVTWVVCLSLQRGFTVDFTQTVRR
jgi:hypothetical protein